MVRPWQSPHPRFWLLASLGFVGLLAVGALLVRNHKERGQSTKPMQVVKSQDEGLQVCLLAGECRLLSVESWRQSARPLSWSEKEAPLEGISFVLCSSSACWPLILGKLSHYGLVAMCESMNRVAFVLAGGEHFACMNEIHRRGKYDCGAHF